MSLRSLLVLGLATLSVGCLPDLGECDSEAARTVVYTADLDGFPAYAGQALLHRSCGSGEFCHSERAEGTARNGATIDLNFDLDLAGGAESTERLRRGQLSVFEHRRQIMATIESETMPPGEVGDFIRDSGPVYRELPEIETAEGMAIVRNWLACDVPVVERARPDRPTGVEPVGATVMPVPELPPCDQTLCGTECADLMSSRNHCGDCGAPCANDEICSAGVCTPCAGMVSFSADVEPIFEREGCNDARGCHAGDPPASELDLSLGVAHAQLVDMPSSCTDGRPLVTPGLVSNSFLMNKILGVDLCGGARMPLRGDPLTTAEIQIIEAWICDGAMED